jgi:hypothetical protein
MSEIVYVFTNPAMPGFIKIGMTTRDDVKHRLKELSDPTGVPMPFECPYAAEVPDATKAEKAIHDAFDDYRPNKSREFFVIPQGKIIDLLKAFAISDKTPLAQEILDEITSSEDKSAQAAANDRRSNLRFNKIDIPLGAELAFKIDPSKKCTVVEDKKVRYNGEITSLSALAMILLHEVGRTSAYAVNGALYFTYEGELLNDRRDRLESERDA